MVLTEIAFHHSIQNDRGIDIKAQMGLVDIQNHSKKKTLVVMGNIDNLGYMINSDNIVYYSDNKP